MPITIPADRRREVLEARQRWEDVLSGDLRARAEVLETLSTSDFPELLGASYARELLSEYQAASPVWSQWATRVEVNDFKPKKLIEILGGRGQLSPVKEAGEYPARGISTGAYEFKIGKFGDRIPLTWEMIVNDELGAFRGLPNRLAVAARETEDVEVAKSLFNAGGTNLNTQFFSAGNGNAPANLPLTGDNLAAALQTLRTRKDKDSRPIIVPTAILMVSPALENTARRILEASEIRVTEGGVTTVQSNYLRDSVTLVVNPWLSLAAPGYSNLDTTWFLLPPTNSPRPAFVAAFLRGHGAPDLRVKADTGSSVGGGSLSPEDGSFDNDTIQYRVRHVMGGAGVIPTATYVSRGA